MSFKEFKTHFPTEISKSLARYVNSTVLKTSRYLFTRTAVGAQFAYCTHCNKQHHVEGEKLKHKQVAKCPYCKSKCKVQSAGISRKYLYDKAVFVWYERSIVNPQAITARIIAVYRDYSGDFKDVKTEYNCSHMYLFEPGQSQYYKLEAVDHWNLRASVFSAFDVSFSGSGFHGGSWYKYMSIANIKKAVKGTSFQYSTWKHYTTYKNKKYASDMVCFFDMAALYPCLEYLTKLGFDKLVWAKLYQNAMHSAVHWRGKTPEKVLRISRSDIHEIRNSGLSFGPHELKYFQDQKRSGNNISAEDAFILAQLDNDIHRGDIKSLEELAPRDRILFYLLKQFRRYKTTSIANVLYDWKDYQRQCKKLGMSLGEDRYLFPNDLQKDHQKLTKRIKLKENKHLDKLIAARLNELNTLRFEWKGLVARPIESLNELFEEAKVLDHCVGGYADRYAKGETNLFVIRKKKKPLIPYFTMQCTEKDLVQCRGFKNCDMTGDVQAFVNAFVKGKLKMKPNKAPASRQEVTV